MTATLQTDRLILQQLSVEDAVAIGNLYRHPEVCANYEMESLGTFSEVVRFTNRIINSSAAIWSIRLMQEPERIIGDCAIHHYDDANKSIEMGGTLFSDYWGKGLMAEAMSVMTSFSINLFNIRKIILKTSGKNINAIRLAEKLGFIKTVEGVEEVFCKIISD